MTTRCVAKGVTRGVMRGGDTRGVVIKHHPDLGQGSLAGNELLDHFVIGILVLGGDRWGSMVVSEQ